jgi:hypothetical protein
VSLFGIIEVMLQDFRPRSLERKKYDIVGRNQECAENMSAGGTPHSSAAEENFWCKSWKALKPPSSTNYNTHKLC